MLDVVLRGAGPSAPLGRVGPAEHGEPHASASMRSATRPRRIVLYSHDTQGLGHMRRNLLLAQALLALKPQPNILLVGGARELGALAIPQGIDCLTLPALHKHGDGAYLPRSLSISLRRIIGLRAGAILAALSSFDPDLLIADKVPLGVFGELEPTLRWARARGRARCVLGLREVLDAPEVARREWSEAGNDAAIRSYYDEVWVYGDPAIYDPASEYGFAPEVVTKLVYIGYLDRSVDSGQQQDAAICQQLDIPTAARVALCCVGGGQDGFALAQSFAAAPLPSDMVGVILTGPFMAPAERQQLQHMAAARPQLRIAAFLAEPALLLRRADAVVAMAGYNTACEILSYGKRALLVPRVRPRQEQLIRAERLRDAGLVEMLHPDVLSPQALGEWLGRPATARGDARGLVDLGALRRLPALARRLMSPETERLEVAYGA